MTVRPASRADGGALRELDHASWGWESSPSPRPPSDRDFFHREDDPDDVLVALTGDVLVGYVRLGHPTPLESNRHVFEIGGLAVDPAYRRRGLASRLLAQAAQTARDRGARRLRLRVLADNVAARRLYESCGYRAEGVLRGEFQLDGRYVDDVLMACDLVAGVQVARPAEGGESESERGDRRPA